MFHILKSILCLFEGEPSEMPETAAVALPSLDIVPDEPSTASTSSPMQTVEAKPTNLTGPVDLSTESSCLTSHAVKRPHQATKASKDSFSKVEESCSSDSEDDEADTDNKSSSGEDSDTSQKQAKKKKKKPNDEMSTICTKLVNLMEQKVAKSKSRNKRLKKEKGDLEQQISSKDEALCLYENLVDAIVTKTMANGELSAVLELSLVPGASAVIEQSKIRVANKLAANSAT